MQNDEVASVRDEANEGELSDERGGEDQGRCGRSAGQCYNIAPSSSHTANLDFARSFSPTW
jgi:hypothetical protein